MAPPSNTPIRLRNGVEMPPIGFGVYLSPPEVCQSSCLRALECNYRLIDTAQFYANESQVGLALTESSVPRRQVFLATKILEPTESVEGDYQQCLASIKKLDPKDEYVDLYLIHSVNPSKEKRQQMWLALEQLYAEGRAKSIGVSNYGISHIEEMKGFADTWPPHVNQIELHPWLQQKKTVAYCTRNSIQMQAYCPLARNTKSRDEVLCKIAQKHGVDGNRVLVRYCMQKGWVPLPKSDNHDRIQSNADVFGLALDPEDMTQLDDLDQGPEGALVRYVDE